MIFIIIAIVAVLALIVFARVRKLDSPIPIMAGSSLIISAACHPPQRETSDMALKPLAWDVLGEEEEAECKVSELRHCSFSTEEVSSPAQFPQHAGPPRWPGPLVVTGKETVVRFA